MNIETKTMKNGEWQKLVAVTNLGDDYDVFGRMIDEGLEIVYFAFNGLKRVILEGVMGCPDMDTDYTEIVNQVQNDCGDDWELALMVQQDGATAIVVMDSCNDLVEQQTGFNTCKIYSVEEFIDDELSDALESDEDLVTAAMLIGITE